MFILHIITYSSAFTQGFIKFMRKYFSNYSHKFVVYGTNEVMGEECYCMKSYRPVDEQVKKWIKDCDLIIVNGLFGGEKLILYAFFSCIKKTYLLFWGGDFYYLKSDYTSVCSLKKKAWNFIKKVIIQNAGGVINLVPDDFEVLSGIVKISGKRFVAPVTDDGETDDMFRRLQNVPKATNPVRILVGNSATPSNQHKEIFILLSRFSSEMFQVICPLSYGEEGYRREVIKDGIELLGDRFVPLIDYIEKEEYFRLIASASVCIFNHNRQQALGNIYAALALSAKVYLRKDTTMWKYLTKSGYQLFDVDDLKNEIYMDIIAYNEEKSKINKEIYRKKNSTLAAVEPWKRFFINVIDTEEDK